ncbi:MAG: hypothetical protein K2X09_00925 [Rickettsiales bacterium]|nr:hypothetical protein [Rickettsiales bacterium]
MDTPNGQAIYVYDHPESKIRFLETTLRGQDWRLRIAYPANDPTANGHIAAVREAYARKGYVLKDSADASGNNILELHHLGEGGSPTQLLRELGFIKGSGHLITHPSITLGSLADGTHSIAKKSWNVVRDPARANGLIYLGAEGFLIGSGKKNILQKVAYSFFLAQSFVYLAFAQNNNDASFEQYRKKLDATLKNGGTAESVAFEAQSDKESKGLLRTIGNYVRRYPIQIGAALNDIGMGVYALRSVYKKREYADIIAKKIPADAKLLEEAIAYNVGKGGFKLSGFRQDILAAAVSMAAWAFLLITPKHHSDDEIDQVEGKPLQTAWQKFRENPQIGAGLLTLVSSSLRLSTSLKTNDRKQTIGESLYIGGDFALLFTKNDNYGSKNSKDVEVLAKRIAEHLADQPFVYGPTSQEKVVESMATFLRAKTLQEIKDNPQATKFTVEELNERREVLVREVKLRIRNHQDERMERVADMANRISQWAPEAERDALIGNVSEALSQLPWVHVTPDEMRKAMMDSRERRPEITAPKNAKELREAITDLTTIVPRIDKGATVAALYDALGTHLNHEAPAINSKPSETTVSSALANEMLQQPAHHTPSNRMAPANHVYQVERQASILSPVLATAQSH